MNECRAQFGSKPTVHRQTKGGVGSSGIFLRSNKSKITRRHFTNVIKRNIIRERKVKQVHR